MANASMKLKVEHVMVAVEWEYYMALIPPEEWTEPRRITRVTEDCEALGRDRWELVSVSEGIMFFKRPKEEQKPIIVNGPHP